MKVLELFSGTRSIGRAFEKRGHDVFSVDYDERFVANVHEDIEYLTPEMVLEMFGRPDVIWASPDCTTFSIAGISHHRTKNQNTGQLDAKSEYALKCDRVDLQTVRLIRDLRPTYWFIENPRGGVAQDGLDAMGTALHGHVLPVRRHAHEAHRHLHQPPAPHVQAAVQERRPLPRISAARREDWHAGAGDRG